MQYEKKEITTMRLTRHFLYFCFIPFICVLAAFGLHACTAQQAADTAAGTIQTLGDRVADLPQNVNTAAPYMQQDLEKLWYDVAGTFEACGDNVGVSEPPHPLVEAEAAREKLIAGESFNEVVANATRELTPDDLKSIPSSDLEALNGVLPFEVDLESCGENLAEVLNSLDIGQVSAILKSKAGYHLIQLLDRDGVRVRIGHIVFEIKPADDVPEDEPQEAAAAPMTPFDEAIAKLNKAIEEQRR